MRTANPDAVFVTTTSGFIVNALLFPYLNRAVKLFQDRQTTADEIDEVMTLACSYPLGPIRLLDVAATSRSSWRPGTSASKRGFRPH